MSDFLTTHVQTECSNPADIFAQATDAGLHFISGIYVLGEADHWATCRDAVIHQAQTHGFYVVANEVGWIAVNLRTMMLVGSVADFYHLLAVKVEARDRDLGEAAVIMSDGQTPDLEAVLTQSLSPGRALFVNGGRVNLL